MTYAEVELVENLARIRAAYDQIKELGMSWGSVPKDDWLDLCRRMAILQIRLEALTKAARGT